MNRISRQQMFMEMAHTVAKRSTCMRLSVGCVLVSNRNILSIGYNGPPAGEPHCTGKHCSHPGQGCYRAVHAEINAFEKVHGSPILDPSSRSASIAASSRFAVSPNAFPIDVYVTDSPCLDCFDLITRPWWKVSSIYFTNLYRVNNHLVHPTINIYQLTPSGYIIDFQTGELVD